MSHNENTTDRIIRIVLALVLLALILTQTVTGTLAVVFGVLGVVFVATAAMGFCPLYQLFGISTCAVKR